MSWLRLFVHATFGVLALILLAAVHSSAAQGLASADLSRLRSVGSVAVSPDGHRVAYTIAMRDRPGRPYGQLWIMDLDTQKSVRVGSEKDSSSYPLWSPDSKQIAFISSTPSTLAAEASGDPMVISRYLYKPDAG
jgi:Tol biopolymer transport system component